MRFRNFLLFALALVTSCATSFDDEIAPTPDVSEGHEVVIGASGAVATRTAVDDNSVKWCVGDQVALWAEGGSSAFSNKIFTLRYYGDTFNQAVFASKDVEPMKEGTYDYSAFYPATSDDGYILIDGKNVTYTIPATQCGDYNGELDYRVAHLDGQAPLSDEIILNSPKLEFRSLTHALKITIPEGYGEDEINKLLISISKNVVGSVSVNMEDTKVRPQISSLGTKLQIKINDDTSYSTDNGSFITLDLGANTIKSGDGKFVWVFLNPTDDVKAMSISSINKDGKVVGTHNMEFTDGDGIDFEAGCYTQVNLGANYENPQPMITLKFAEGTNNLGESADNITITAPDGITFADNKSTVQATKSENFFCVECNLDNYIRLKKKTISIAYDTPHANVSNTLQLISDNYDTFTNCYKYTVPYLLFEDFSGITKDFSVHDNQTLGANLGDGIDGDYDGSTELSDYGLPVGWTASRVGGSEKSETIRICGREEAGYKYPGRLDTPRLPFKAGKSAKILVSYNYSGGEKEWGTNNGAPCFQYGYTLADNDDGINGKKEMGKVISDGWIKQGTNGSYSSVTLSNKNFNVPSANNQTRITWRASCDKKYFWTQNGNYWLYIDNVKVKIVK